jgi:hypothetical protein
MTTPWKPAPQALRWIGAVVLLLALLSTTGCSAMAVALGLRVRLDELPVTAVSASLANGRNASAVNASAAQPGCTANDPIQCRIRSDPYLWSRDRVIDNFPAPC